MIETGKKAPSFALKNQDDRIVRLKDFAGKTLVLYFYPKDLTSVCTQEACDFRDSIRSFGKLDTAVVGVSPDPVKSHKKFFEKHCLNFDLLSDEEKKTLQAYGVWKEKSMYGRKYMGVERTTVIISAAGKITHIFNKVSVKGHIEAVLAALRS